MGFGELHPIVQHHVVNSLGWRSLRPLQEAAITPVLQGVDALLLAPTAGGKTEAAMFPLLSRAATERWPGLSLLYVCPLRALLNNLEPRISLYASWLGLRVGLWHGDTPDGVRRRLLDEPPTVLLTTPESLEAMLVSTRVDPRAFFGGLRAVVSDEVHAFAGDDRGWHLLAVLERLERIAGRKLQRVGLSATVGNPHDLLRWLQGSDPQLRRGQVIGPEDSGSATADVTLDHVGSVANAAKVIAGLHAGEKRLVFCDSKRQVEELAVRLGELDVTTFVSHASLSRDERRRSEQAFAEARDCVIVATSTLELGIDVGDLDKVIQIDAPRSVASFLQRLGRTGRRTGARRNTLFLATSERALLHAAGLLLEWSRGWVEPIVPPPHPRQLITQQLLALCLQEHRVGDASWREWWGSLPVFDDSAPDVMRWLLETKHLEADEGMLFIGPEAEKRYGRRHFMELLASFAGDPAFQVLHGQAEIGFAEPASVVQKTDGPRVIVLAGRRWQITHTDWKRRRCWVEPAADAQRAGADRPRSFGVIPLSYRLSRARRLVLLGELPPVTLTRRAESALSALRETQSGTVSAGGSIIGGAGDDLRWWTWAGARANATIAASLPSVVDDHDRFDNDSLRLRADVDSDDLTAAISKLGGELALPAVDDAAVRGLKFADSLPPALANETLAARLADTAGARGALAESRMWLRAYEA